MAGRKPNADIHGPSAYLPTEVKKKDVVIHGLYTISHKPEFVRGAKKEIRDVFGKLIWSARQMSHHIEGIYTKEQAETIKSNMKEQGIKNIKLHKTILNLPSKCPACHHDGSPTMYKGKGTVRTRDKWNNINRDEIRLTYNHSQTKPKTCPIATVDLDSAIPKINLISKLSHDCLDFRSGIGYHQYPNFKLSD